MARLAIQTCYGGCQLFFERRSTVKPYEVLVSLLHKGQILNNSGLAIALRGVWMAIGAIRDDLADSISAKYPPLKRVGVLYRCFRQQQTRREQTGRVLKSEYRHTRASAIILKITAAQFENINGDFDRGAAYVHHRMANGS
jgi:hypothetical protein